MICDIRPPHAHPAAAVRYNEKKMFEDEEELKRTLEEKERREDVREFESGRVLAAENIPEGRTLVEEFNRCAEVAMKTTSRGPVVKNTSFHMSVNPSELDPKMDDDTAVQFMKDLMERLGYGGQPYKIYKHTDIERMHYHIVSTRIGPDGKKIPDSYERYKLREALKELSKIYGFSLEDTAYDKSKSERKGARTGGPSETPAQESQDEKKKEASEEPEKKYVPRFMRNSRTPVKEQLQNIVEDAMKWHFSTFEQFQAMMMRRYSVLVEIEKGEKGLESENHLVFSGVGFPCRLQMTPMRDNILGNISKDKLAEKCSTENMSVRRSQKARIANVARGAAVLADNYDKFTELMFRKGIDVVISWNRDNEPFGVTYIDRATRCIWKGSETEVPLDWLRATAQQKGWILKKDPIQEAIDKRVQMPSRSAYLDTAQKAQPSAGAEAGTDRQKAIGSTQGGKKISKGAVADRSAGSTLRNKKDDIWDDKQKPDKDEGRTSEHLSQGN